MRSFRPVTQLCFLLLLAPLLSAADLSSYRGFQFGMSLAAAVSHSGMDISEVTLVRSSPARIQELNWRPARFLSADSDPVDKVLFSFYNGKLFRVAVDYDHDKTAGLSTPDMITALSAQYGSAVIPAVETRFPSTSFIEGVKVVARWEDADYSFNLVQPPYGSGFGLIAYSKRLDGLAETAIASGMHLDERDAPQQAKLKEQKAQSELEKTRLVNIGHFRP